MLLKPDHCKSCYGWNWGCSGYVPADGTGDNGILVVLEAAGEQEAESGIPTVGAAGQFLWNQLHRVGIEREGFRIHNVLSCRPPQNKLTKMPYELQVINHCAPLLDQTIQAHVKHCKEIGKNPVIVALGKIAFKRLMNVDDRSPIMRKSYISYPFWSAKYQSWIISSHHPSHLMQGKQYLTPILTWTFQRAIEIANEGCQIDNLEGAYLEDPEAATFSGWVDDYCRYAAQNADSVLSYDIETPYKEEKDESEITLADDLGVILRCSFSYCPGTGVSVPWKPAYYPALAKLFGSNFPKVGWNNSLFDAPKIREYFPINGDDIDAMLAWHVLNTAFPKGLGFVTPFYAKTMSMWKHLDRERPAFYNACDADAALRCWLGIQEDLKKNGLWDVFQRHVIEVHRIFSYMSTKGVLLDGALRAEAEGKLTKLVSEVEEKMEAAIPLAARKLKVYKKTPKDTAGMIQVEQTAAVKRCSICKMVSPKAAHFKPVSNKKLKLGLDNVCEDAKVVIAQERVALWAKPLGFKVSKLGLTSYQGAVGHKAIFDRKKGKTSYDESAMMRLMKKYPADALYPLILEHRELSKLLGTYIGVTQLNGDIRGGMPIGKDGRIHCQFTSNPNTLRSASNNPNMQNLPRPSDERSSIVRNLIVASPGNILYARDFAGIEAVLVGYDAAAPGYIRLARRDVHTYYTAWALNELEPGRIPANDLPLLSWTDDHLFGHLEHLKKQLKKERNSLYKHLVHAANFMQSAKGAAAKIYVETGQEFPLPKVQRVMDIYFELFPEIRRWHGSILEQADKDGYIRNAFGYLMRFSHVFNWEKMGERWVKTPNHDVANKVIASGPQSNAAGIIKEAMITLSKDYFEEAGQWLRLLVHDELLFDVPEGQVDKLDQVCQTVMELPYKQFPLPEAYGLGPYLSILTEPKRGATWATMK